MTSAKQANSLFMVKSSSRLLVELLTRDIAHAADSQQGSIHLAQKLLTVAEAAYTRQDLHTLKEVGDLLVALPLPQAQRAGLWYQAVIQKREGRLIEASQSLEKFITDSLTAPRFRARAFQTLGLIYHGAGNLTTARQLYIESAQYIRRESPLDAYVFAISLILHSHIRADEGDSRQALRELLSIEKLVEAVYNALLTATFYNNVAVGLLELGRVEEAASYSRIACSSPFATAYPECRETALEIEKHSAKRNIVAVAVSLEPRKRRAQPKFLIVVSRFSPPIRGARPVTFRQRVTCNNPTTSLVASVIRIRAPSL